jgi:mRNA-degrading endonuclease YafQ of YafQ-DinJ toxin-antitoxin module
MVFDWFFGGPIGAFRSKAKAAEATVKKFLRDISHKELEKVSTDLGDLASQHRELKERFEKQKEYLRRWDSSITENLANLIVVQGQELSKAEGDAVGFKELVKEGWSADELESELEVLRKHMTGILANLESMEALLKRLKEIKEKSEKAAAEEAKRKEEEKKGKKQPQKALYITKPVKYEKQYTDARDGPYEQFKKRIKETEERIMAAEKATHRLHGPIKSGDFKGHLHAHLTGNIVIIYKFDDGEMTFERIMTKNDFDQIAK